MASKRKTRAKAAKKRSTARAASKRQPGKGIKTSALVHTSKRDREAAKSGIAKSKRSQGPGTTGGAAGRDFPNAVYEDERRS